jgi:hypothetical protein
VEMDIVYTSHYGFLSILPGVCLGKWFVNIDFLFWMVEFQFRRQDR